MVHRLKMPHTLAGARVESDHGIGVKIVAGTKAAEIVGTGLPVGIKTRLRSTSTEMMDHALAAPEFSRLTGCQVQRSAPVRVSNARTSPEAPCARTLSAIPEPTITRFAITAGGEVSSYSPLKRGLRRSPSVRSISPLRPKSAHGFPDAASSAVSRASILAK